MRLFAQLVKVDEERRLIFARAATEEIDRSGEIFDYKTSRPLFEKWSDGVFADTAGKSLGNVRAMHSAIAAGKLTGIEYDDSEKAIDVALKVVDDNEWNKVLEGVYTGLSIGGRYIKRWADVIDGREVTRYTAAPSEISLVDRPCMPSSRFFDVLKRDGSVEHVEFRNAFSEVITMLQKRAGARKDFTASGSATSGITSYTVGGNKGKKRVRKEVAGTEHEDQNAEQPTIAPQPMDAKPGKSRSKRPPDDPAPEVLDGMDPDHHVSSGPDGSTSTTKRDFSAKERAKAADAGEAMPDGSYPIKTKQDLHNAIQAFGRAKDKGKTKAHIKSRAKALGATSMLPEDWGGAKKAEGCGYTVEDLLEKGCGSVAALANILCSLEGWVMMYAMEQADEDDDEDTVGSQVHGKVAELLELLAECAEEEASEMSARKADGIQVLPAEARLLLKRIEEVQKRGSGDQSLLNKLHDTAVELGASCSTANKGDSASETQQETSMRVTKAKPDLAGLIGKAVLEALRKGGIETEGPKRGATIGSEVDSEHSDNEERDPEEGTLDGSAGEDNPKNSHRETTRRGVGKAAKPDNQDEEDMDDEDEEDGDGEEATPPPKAKGKASKAKKVATSEDDEDNLTKSELVELIATTVVGTLQGLGVVNKADGTEDDDAVGKIASRARRPAVFAVGKGDDGRVGKADGAAEQAGDPLELALQKSLGTRNLTPILKNDGSVDQPASLIKHILSGRPMKSVTADSLSEAK